MQQRPTRKQVASADVSRNCREARVRGEIAVNRTAQPERILDADMSARRLARARLRHQHPEEGRLRRQGDQRDPQPVEPEAGAAHVRDAEEAGSEDDGKIGSNL